MRYKILQIFANLKKSLVEEIKNRIYRNQTFGLTHLFIEERR